MMTVKQLMNHPRGIQVIDNYSGDCLCQFDGWIVLKPKAKRKFKEALKLEWWFNGSETAIVNCKSDDDVTNLVYLLNCIDGEKSDITDDEWNALFREPTDEEWEKLWKKTGTYYEED